MNAAKSSCSISLCSAVFALLAALVASRPCPAAGPIAAGAAPQPAVPPALEGPLPLVAGAYRSPASLYGLGYVPVPPYFALHPPVSYGLPVRRPYGLSPYAHSGDFLPPARPEPQVIVNGTVRPAEQPAEVAAEQTMAAARTSAAAQPQLIVNPYCPRRVARR